MALVKITHHGGFSARRDIAKHSLILLRIAQERPKAVYIVESVVAILSHSVVTIVNKDEHPDPKLLESLDIKAMVRVLTENVKNPKVSHELINHAMDLLTCLPYHYSETCRNYLPLLRLLVAGLRSTD